MPWGLPSPPPPFIQSVSGNANAEMGAAPIHFAALALPLTLTLCVNSLNKHCNTHMKDNANALCERAITRKSMYISLSNAKYLAA